VPLSFAYTWPLKYNNEKETGITLNTSRTQMMVSRLNQLRSSSPDILGAAIVSSDGLPIASVLSPDVEEDRVAAMSAAMVSLGERITAELGRGKFEQVYIKGDVGFALLTSIGTDSVLTVIANGEARLGLLLLELRKSVDDLESLI
jgi:hypothetical protein